MRTIFIAALVLGLAGLCAGQKFYGTTDLKVFRDGRDREMRNKDESPLLEIDRESFKGLNYYSYDKRFRVNARFTRTSDEKLFDMPTSSGKIKRYAKYGILKFRLLGKERTLSVYQMEPAMREKFPDYADLLFVPFRDATNRTETYGGGRYVDIWMPRGDGVVLDLNLAYNPSCAYGTGRYNCPIPPSENKLDVAVTAGEKRFAHTKEAAAPEK